LLGDLGWLGDTGRWYLGTVVPWYTCTILVMLGYTTHTTQHTQHSTHNMHRLGVRGTQVAGPRLGVRW
jgi:hypothetical protein